ncbi:hypothetical protein VTK73DRAFT_2384 [Phialemonium thermophilum]|uniref:Zn(2)-C6 fungal-type domain-containing protein n=1 Tax=Phialemonium thermophilum TaxID=223376 RepID=A0ABR3X4I4_9PEZI
MVISGPFAQGRRARCKNAGAPDITRCGTPPPIRCSEACIHWVLHVSRGIIRPRGPGPCPKGGSGTCNFLSSPKFLKDSGLHLAPRPSSRPQPNMGRMDPRKACLNCRQRHLRCDRELPSCRRCRLANLVCDHRVVHSFRNVSFAGHGEHQQQSDRDGSSVASPSSADGHWPGLSRVHTVPRIIDETESVVEAYRAQKSPAREEVGHRNKPRGERTPPSSLSPSATYFFNNPPSIIGLPLAAGVHHVSSPSAATGSELPSSSSDVAHPGQSPPRAISDTLIADVYDLDFPPEDHVAPLPSDETLPTHTTPTITHPREAYLLKYFTQTWGPIFDCLDADLTFTRSVLHIALTSFQPLFWAILATSALQLSRVSNYPFSAAKYYRSQCSKSLMPILLRSTQPGASEENLFATYVMLRNYEQMTENLSEKNTETLFTAALAIAANPSETFSDEMDLGRAAFWVHLRQDIHVALLLEVPINTDYPPCLHRERIIENLDWITTQKVPARQETIDCAWANRMSVLLVDIINYCFQKGPRNVEEWISLRSRLDHWSVAKPKKFQPYYERAAAPSEGRVFPEIWISSDCHVLAWLFYHTGTLLLKAYPPDSDTAPFRGQKKSGPPGLSFLESREEILIHARAICGIAITNPNAQALIVVCHIVTVSAVFFTSEAERNETLNLVQLAHKVTGHPKHDVEKKLRKRWEMIEEARTPDHLLRAR